MLLEASISLAQNESKNVADPVGSLKGKIIDAQTQEQLAGANIVLVNTVLGGASDLTGNYSIDNVPIGNYQIQFSYIGYKGQIKADIIIRPQRITYVNGELKPDLLETESISVTSGYFVQNDEQPLSIINFSREEIRRAPGSAGDVSRIIMSLPSVAKVNDQSNSLIVRGGSPVENSFYIDNIEIPNINHFPTHGSSGGPIGIINVDFIEDVEFSAGGFSTIYGDKLSSIMNIRFREGSRDEFQGQLDLNWAGFGGVFEGPMLDKNGSYLFSARRSYLDWIIKMFDTGTSIAPTFGDIQGKLVYDLSADHQLSILGIFADSHSNSTKEIADENAMTYYGNQNIYEFSTGINWRAIWTDWGFSNTSISYTSAIYDELFFETATTNPLLRNKSRERGVTLRHINSINVYGNNVVQFGLELKHRYADLNNFYAETRDPVGNIIPAFNLSSEISVNEISLFSNYMTKPINNLSINLGLRMDHLSYNDRTYLSPRFSFSYALDKRSNLNGSIGNYYQNLPLVLMAQSEKNIHLNTMMATHYILGIDHMVTPDTKLTFEIYQKDYQNFPLDPQLPGFYIIDELYYNYGFFSYHEELNDLGLASSHGIEIMAQKKLAKDFYGLTSFSYFRSRYADEKNVWRDRVYDNRFIFSIEGGYKPSNEWEFSLRWIYAGGPPYTPFNMEASMEQNRGILDIDHINEARYPDYHSLNVRLDKRFHFSRSNLVMYISVWNLYNNKNIASYYWNEQKNEPDIIYQWGMLPIFGLEYEF